VRLLDRAQACVRLSALSDKSAVELQTLLEKWFAKHFVKGINLPMLKQMHGSEAYAAFEACLGASSEADLIAIIRKVDPHCVGILSGTRSELAIHIQRLAAGHAPTPRTKRPRTAKKQTATGAPKSGGVLARSRQGPRG